MARNDHLRSRRRGNHGTIHGPGTRSAALILALAWAAALVWPGAVVVSVQEASTTLTLPTLPILFPVPIPDGRNARPGKHEPRW
jgi:hypothetical protein